MSESQPVTDGYIVVETNYRVYAYTCSFLRSWWWLIVSVASPIVIAILSLFIDLKARFPNMVTGMISRDKIRDALDKGISADQVLFCVFNGNYLRHLDHFVLGEQRSSHNATKYPNYTLHCHWSTAIMGLWAEPLDEIPRYLILSKYSWSKLCRLHLSTIPSPRGLWWNSAARKRPKWASVGFR